MANNTVFDNLKSRVGQSVVVTIGGDSTSYRGTLLDVHPNGTTSSDGGANSSAIDTVGFTVAVSRTKS